MDPVSHGALGASWAQTPAGAARLGPAALVGSLAALTPDLDALIQSESDPLLVLEYHRQFTHALAFAPVGALMCAFVLHRLVRGRLTFGQTYAFALLGFGSHALLDACTSYGTELLWPFSDARVAWSIVAVIDPGFTFPALALVVLAIWRRRARYAQLAAAWALAYLGLGVGQHLRAASAGAALAASRGHAPARLEVKPALGTVFLWKIIYEHDGRYYVDAVRVGLTPRVHAGESIAKLDVRRDFPWLAPDTRQAQDIERFRRVADGFVAVDSAAPDRVVDIRYSMVPNEIAGFWAIVLDPAAGPNEHVGFVTTRNAGATETRRLLDMLF